MSEPITLDYHHGTSNRYEWEMEAERARWMRKRFQWFCGVSVALTAIFAPHYIYRLFTSDGYSFAAAIVDAISAAVYLAIVGTAWWIAQRHDRTEVAYSRFAMGLVIVTGLIGLVTLRVTSELAFSQALIQLSLDDRSSTRMVIRPATPAITVTQGARDTADAGARAGLRQGDAITGSPRRPTPGQVKAFGTALSVGTMGWVLFSSHFIACLFLPWTVRESVRPAVVLLIGAGAVILFDVVIGRASFWSLPISAALLPLTLLPGIGWCWWRYSRFRRNFRFVFESNQFRQLRHELDGARRVHEASLPPIHREGPLRLSYVYEPMQQMGGDVIFVHPRPPERDRQVSHAQMPARHTMILLDVTGHGIAAALTVNRLVGELERLFAEQPDLGAADVIAALNRYVYLTIAAHGIYATGLAVSVDIGDPADPERCYREPHDVCFASAGHPTAFVRRADGRIDPLESNAMMLGVVPPDDYEIDEHVFRLRPGEAIIAYTDGATEATNRRNQMIGIQGVRDLIQQIGNEAGDPFDWPHQVIRRVAAWRSAPPADDTLIACVYRPPAMPTSPPCCPPAGTDQATSLGAESVLAGQG